ncbi:hypothetical protein [Salinigranum marinum]|uniref:hypothetical protein n=1 Tax=Salinigranum marinum TaxID=1515595 RepID=UPI002989D39F|nr:hypothetical protein [Salinigranum marinum]
MGSDVDTDPEADADVPTDRSQDTPDGSRERPTDPASFVWSTDLSATETEADAEPESEPEPESEAALSPTRYLLAGEAITERIDVGRGWVVATTHRVLVYDPAAAGTRFTSIDRPNVVGVGTTGGGNATVLGYVSRAVVYAVLLLGSGLVARSFGLRSLFSVSSGAAETPGVGGLLSFLSLAGTLLGLFVDALILGGVVAGLVAVALAVWYLRGRQPTLVVERAGDDDVTIRLPSAAAGQRAVGRLERELADELAVS